MEIQSNEPKKGISSSWIYLGVIVLLLGAAIYLYLTKNRAEDENEDLTTQVTEVANDKASLETEYNAALARLDEMKNQSVQMDSLLSTKGEEVEALKAKIKSILSDKNASESQLKEANKLIAQLNAKMSSFQSQITALKQENIQLSEEKKQLIDEKDQVSKEKEGLKEGACADFTLFSTNETTQLNEKIETLAWMQKIKNRGLPSKTKQTIEGKNTIE